jgi:hypothetical protein
MKTTGMDSYKSVRHVLFLCRKYICAATGKNNFASYEVLLVTTVVATHISRLIFESITVVFLCVLPSKYTLKKFRCLFASNERFSAKVDRFSAKSGRDSVGEFW